MRYNVRRSRLGDQVHLKRYGLYYEHNLLSCQQGQRYEAIA